MQALTARLRAGCALTPNPPARRKATELQPSRGKGLIAGHSPLIRVGTMLRASHHAARLNQHRPPELDPPAEPPMSYPSSGYIGGKHRQQYLPGTNRPLES